jgi:hypothetical protein
VYISVSEEHTASISRGLNVTEVMCNLELIGIFVKVFKIVSSLVLKPEPVCHSLILEIACRMC